MNAPTLLAVAHGSKEPKAAEVFERLIDRVRVAEPNIEVKLSYVDHRAPSVTQGLDACIAHDRDIVVVPLLLSAATHAKGDIPAAIKAFQRRNPQLGITYARVLGPHPLLLQAMQQRLAAIGVSQAAAVVLAATGSADPDANAEIAKVARLLWEWRHGQGPVEAAYASATTPTIPEAISRLRKLGHREIAVASYVLAPGRFAQSIASMAAQFHVTEPFGDSAEVATLVLQRYVEAARLSPPSSCDTCIYRVSWPGHEHRVGAPQQIHSHPAD